MSPFVSEKLLTLSHNESHSLLGFALCQCSGLLQPFLELEFDSFERLQELLALPTNQAQGRDSLFISQFVVFAFFNPITHSLSQVHWVDAEILFQLFVYFNHTIICKDLFFLVLFPLFFFFLKFVSFDFPELIKTVVGHLITLFTFVSLTLDLLQGHVVFFQVASLFEARNVIRFKHLVLRDEFFLKIRLLRASDIVIEVGLKECVFVHLMVFFVLIEVFWQDWKSNRR